MLNDYLRYKQSIDAVTPLTKAVKNVAAEYRKRIRKEKDMERHITVPVAKEEIQDLRAGDYVYLTGVIYTARDAAHKRMDEVLSEGKELPLDIKNQMIYYMGPSPAREGRPIGSAGPTTASRVWIRKLSGKEAIPVAKIAVWALRKVKNLIHTIMADNGKEFYSTCNTQMVYIAAEVYA